jgi:PKD repeat protein
MQFRRRVAPSVAAAMVASLLPLGVGVAATVLAPSAVAAQAKPNHTKVVPAIPRRNLPRIGNGEIWDMAVIGNRVFIAGTFTSITTPAGAVIGQRYLAAYNYDTGQVDTTFRPTFDGNVNTVEASPDGTKLFIGGTFNTVNGVTRRKVASINLTTGAPVSGFAFTSTTNNPVTALAATNSTLYVGGRFTRINGAYRTGLAAVNSTTGAIDTGFTNDLAGGIGAGGVLTVQDLVLTHDDAKLMVVHTGRQIAGQDRLGVGFIDTQTKQLLPWRSRIWDQYLPVVGGVQRIYGADIAPNDDYFVVTSGSGGDRPPINDTAIAFPVNGGDFVEPIWVSRAFDSIYSVAITEAAVYIGGHFSWNESPTANQPWPGLDNVGYGNGQGLSGYGLGDQVVRRDHLGALDTQTGTAIEWNPGSSSFEGVKAMLATPRGLFVGADGARQGGLNTGRVAFYDFNGAPAATAVDTTIDTPIEGRVITAGSTFSIQGTAKAAAGVNRVQVEVVDRTTGRWLQDDLTTWGASNTILATLGDPGAGLRPWSLTLNLAGTRPIQIRAKTFAVGGASDPVKALKNIETFSFDDQTPTTSITGPPSPQSSTTFTMTGTAADDHGVSALTYWFRSNGQYLQDDGTVSPIYNTFRGLPDVVGATSATWSYEVTLPFEGEWRAGATAIDTAGQADLRESTRDWLVSSSTVPPAVTIQQPTIMTPPASTPSVSVVPGSPMTFAGTAFDDDGVRSVEVTLRNNSTGESLGSDGTWGTDVVAGAYRVSPMGISGTSYNWSWTTPFNLAPGQYSFTVRATDEFGLSTSTTNRGALTVNAQQPGDSYPDALLTSPGTGQPSLPSARLDLNGTGTDDKGVSAVRISIYESDSGRYVQPNGTLASGFATQNAVLATPDAKNTGWSLSLDLPAAGDYRVTARAFDTAGQGDPTTTGATGRYLYFPGDAAPGFEPTLGQPVTGSAFTDGRIQVSGRAIDDRSIARVEVAVIDSAGRYMSSSGTFTSTTPSWRTAFLNSPGSPGSNYSYTTPVLPDGTYRVDVRATDSNDQVGAPVTATGVTVTRPLNNPPVADATVSCVENVCSFDARTSTDENAATLTYSWNFGTNQGTATGPVPVKRYNAPGTFSVVLTVRDEWSVTATKTLSVTIAEPGSNAPPVPTFTTNCLELVCGVTSAGTTDPNVGDTISYLWDWGDLTATSTGAGASHVYAAPGTYLVTLTATDGWGKSDTTTRTVTLTEPIDNDPPTAQFTATCTALVCQMDSTGTNDPEGNQLRYQWNFGDGTTSTLAYPTKTYSSADAYSVTLTVTDGWNRSSGPVTQTVTVGP